MTMFRAWWTAFLLYIGLLAGLVAVVYVSNLLLPGVGGFASLISLGLLIALGCASLVATPLLAWQKGRNPLLWFIAAWCTNVWAWMAVMRTPPLNR